jgi:ABC-type phosphate transport system substrate-binding protein
VPIVGPIPGLTTVAGVVAPDLTSEDVGTDAATAIVLTREALGDIFRGAIRFWNDTRITAANPHLSFPSGVAIRPVVRADKSGTSEVFKQSIASFSADFATELGCPTQTTCSSSLLAGTTWPTGISSTKFSASGSSAMTAKTSIEPGAIGYTSLAGAKAAGSSIVRIRNRAGRAVSATVSSLSAALFEKGGTLNHRFNADVHDAFSALAFPIVGYTYLVVRTSPEGMRTNSTCSNRIEALKFWSWFYSSEIAASGAASFEFAVLPEFLRERMRIELRQSVECAPGVLALPATTKSSITGVGSVMLEGPMRLLTSTYGTVDAQAPFQYQTSTGVAVLKASFGVGSLTAGSSDFLVSVHHASDAAIAASSTVHSFPVALAPVHVVYRVESLGSHTLRLSVDALIRIFLTGQATQWNDPSIALANPGVTLPSAAIQVLVPPRTSEAGAVFGAFLSRLSNTARTHIAQSSHEEMLGGLSPTADIWTSNAERLETSTIAAKLKLVDHTIAFLPAAASLPSTTASLVITPTNVDTAAINAVQGNSRVSIVGASLCPTADSAYDTTALAGSYVMKDTTSNLDKCASLFSTADTASAVQASGLLDPASGLMNLERVTPCACWPLTVPLYFSMQRHHLKAIDAAATAGVVDSSVAVLPSGGCARGRVVMNFFRWATGDDAVAGRLQEVGLAALPTSTRDVIALAAGENVKCDATALVPSGCSIGEQRVPDSKACLPCSEGTFSLDSSGVCHPCPIGGVCPGGSVILADAGFWQLDTDETKLFACGNGDCCPGGSCSLSSPRRCGVGYDNSSKLCALCDTSAGYAYSFGKCTDCSPGKQNLWLLVGIVAAGFVFVVMMMRGDARAWGFKLFTDYAQFCSIVGSAIVQETSIQWMKAFSLDFSGIFYGERPCLVPTDAFSDSFTSMILIGMLLVQALIVFCVEIAGRKVLACRRTLGSEQARQWRAAGKGGCSLCLGICWQGCLPECRSEFIGSTRRLGGAPSARLRDLAAAAGGEASTVALPAPREGELPSLAQSMSIGSRWMLGYVTLLWRILFTGYVAIVKTGLRLFDCKTVGGVQLVRDRNGVQCGTPEHVTASVFMGIVVVLVSVVLPILHMRTMRAELGPTHRYKGVSKAVKWFVDLLDHVLSCCPGGCEYRGTSGGAVRAAKSMQRAERKVDRGGRRRQWRLSLVMLEMASFRSLKYELGGWVRPDQRIWFESWFFLRKTIAVALVVFVQEPVLRSLCLFLYSMFMLIVMVATRPIAPPTASIVLSTMHIGIVGMAGIDMASAVFQLWAPQAPSWILLTGGVVLFFPLGVFAILVAVMSLSQRFPAVQSMLSHIISSQPKASEVRDGSPNSSFPSAGEILPGSLNDSGRVSSTYSSTQVISLSDQKSSGSDVDVTADGEPTQVVTIRSGAAAGTKRGAWDP